MTNPVRTSAKAAITVSGVIALGLIASACATHPKAPSNWGGDADHSGHQPAAHATAPAYPAPAASINANSQLTFTTGCTGAFTLSDRHTGRVISGGRAYHSDAGFIVLDSQGRRTRPVAANINQSLLFLPDCNCRAGGNQRSDLPATHQFAATAPSSTSCFAG